MSLTEECLPDGWDMDERDFWPNNRPLTEGWDGAVLRVVLSIPPPDNHCHSSGKNGRYPVAEYKAWITENRAHLCDVLGDCQPDVSHWWRVWVRLWFPVNSGDPQNRVKPLLDLLSGARIAERGEKNSRGASVAGKIVKHGLLWDDDKRVELREVRLMAVQSRDPRVELVVALGGTPPINEQDERDAAARAEREQAKATAQLARLNEDLEIVARLLDAGVVGRLASPVVATVAGKCGVTEGRVRAAWKNHLASVAISVSPAPGEREGRADE